MCADIYFRGETLRSGARPARTRAAHLSPAPTARRWRPLGQRRACFPAHPSERRGAHTRHRGPGPAGLSEPRSHGAGASRARSPPPAYGARGVRSAASRPHRRRPAGLGPRERPWRPVTPLSSLTSRCLGSGRRHLAELSFKLARSARRAQLARRPAPAREGLQRWEAGSSVAS